MNKEWYVLKCRSRFERAVRKRLQLRGFEAFYPFILERHQWSDRKKNIEIVLFPGYIFCEFDMNELWKIRMVKDVDGLLGVAGGDIPLDRSLIDDLRKVNKHRLPCRADDLMPGKKVEIVKGSLIYLKGVIVKLKEGLRLVINIEILNRSVSVELDRDWVEVMP